MKIEMEMIVAIVMIIMNSVPIMAPKIVNSPRKILSLPIKMEMK